MIVVRGKQAHRALANVVPQRRGTNQFWWAMVLAAIVACVASTLGTAPAAAQDESITVPLKEYENSGVSGTATLQPLGNAIHVSMELGGDPVTGNHPTHIHTGTCADFDPDPTYPLTTVILDDVSGDGISETTVEDVQLRDLLRDDYVILVHKSAEELTNYFVCGDIKVSASVDQMPAAGVGSGRHERTQTTLLGALAVLSAMMSAALLIKRGAHR